MMRVTQTVVLAFFFFQVTVALNVKCLTDNAKEIVNHAVSCGKENDVVLDDMMEVMNDTCEKKYKCTLACLLDAVMLLQEDGNMAIDFIYYIIELAPHEEVKKELRVLFDSCESQGRGHDKCGNAFNLFTCIKEKVPAFVLSIIFGN